jgi:D-3-phosphoglycerate dehydrogenase
MKVLFIDHVHPALQKGLEQEGYSCMDGYHLSKEEVMNIIPDYHGIVIRSRFRIDRAFLDCCHKMDFIARSGSGLENIDTHYAEAKGIRCLNAAEGNRQAVAEHALGMLLSLFNKLHTANQEVREGVWQREANRGLELSGKTVGIIGYGNNGSAFAEVLRGFSCRVMAYDKYKEGFGNDYVEECSLEEIKKEADILSLHIPLTEETKYMVNKDFISQFSKAFHLINTARGKCLDTSSLLAGIENGRILGACLDVFEFEKSSFEKWEEAPEVLKELSKSKKVILSPHVAGWTSESYQKLSEVLLSKILNPSKE